MWVKGSITNGEIDALQKAAKLAWTEHTRYPLILSSSLDAGQCYVTAMWLRERLGGKVGRKEGHYVWLSSNEDYYIDLTGNHGGLAEYAENDRYSSVDPVENERTMLFSKRANSAFDNLPQLMKMGLDYMAEGYIGETPQRELEREQYYHDEPEYSSPSDRKQFVYANGDLLVSDQPHEDLLRQAGVDPDHSGPMAVGFINVDEGQATWEVQSNVDMKAFDKLASDYSRQVGWRYSGTKSVEGGDLGFNVEAAEVIRFVARDNEITMGRTSHSDLASSLGGDDKVEAGVIRVVGNMATMEPIIPQAVEAAYEWATDNGLTLYGSGGYNPFSGPDLTDRGSDNDDAFEKEQDDLNLKDLSRDPSGLYSCPACDKLFPNWKEYQKHRRTEEGDAEELTAPRFPKNDMDATFPPHFTEQPPRIMPVAKSEAERVDGFRGGSDYDDYLVAYHCGSPIGYARLRDGRVAGLHFAKEKEGWADQLLGTIQKYADKDPKDLLSDAIPFIFDVGKYEIVVGQPGQRTSDIRGDFTKGGIVEGVYEPGGKIIIRDDTNMPYSVYGMVNLWYYSYPELSVTGVEMRDEEGGTKKLASEDEYPDHGWRPQEHDYDPTWDYDVQFENLDHPLVQAAQSRLESLAQLEETPMNPERPGRVFPVDLGGNVATYCGGTYNEPCILVDIAAHENDPFPDDPISTYDPSGAIAKSVDHEVRHAIQEWNGDMGDWADEDDAEGWEPDWSKKMASEVSDEEEEDRLKDIGGYICGVLASDPVSFEAAHKLREIGGNVFVVGGAVRDAVLGKEPKDIDLMVTGLEPEKIDAALKELGGRVDVTGKDFGVFRYKNGDGEVEIALPRKEQSTGRGHQDFEVQADPNMKPEEDLWRRDFTVNAMAVDVSNGKLLDPYEGFRDALNGKLRVVNPDALSEDPLRIMRGLAAYARHGLEPTNETLESMKDNAESLNHLPPERIVPELDKILSSPNPSGAFRMAQDSGVLQHFLPEVSAAFGYNQNNPHHEQELGDHLMSVLERVTEKTEDPDVRFAALLHDIGKPGSAWEDPETGSNHFYKKVLDDGTILGANHEELGASMTETLMNRLRFPNDRTKRVSELVNHHMYSPFTSPKGARKFVNRVGDHADDLLHLRWADQGGKSTYPADPNEQFNLETERTLLDEVAQAQAPTAVSQLALNGNDLIAMGMKPGPEVGQTLESLVQRVLDDPTLNERETLLSLVN